MPARHSIEVKGLKELGERMRNLTVTINTKAARSAVGSAAGLVKKSAIAKAPKSDAPHQLGRRKDQIAQPGNLKSNIIVRKIAPSKTNLTSEYVVGVRQGSGKVPKDAFYWLFVEFGTVKMEAQPFLRPALNENVDKAIGVMSKKLKAAIDKAGG